MIRQVLRAVGLSLMIKNLLNMENGHQMELIQQKEFL
nr:MAG TPA: hypothetical protein [Caudoviricetes sp.]